MEDNDASIQAICLVFQHVIAHIALKVRFFISFSLIVHGGRNKISSEIKFWIIAFIWARGKRTLSSRYEEGTRFFLSQFRYAKLNETISNTKLYTFDDVFTHVSNLNTKYSLCYLMLSELAKWACTQWQLFFYLKTDFLSFFYLWFMIYILVLKICLKYVKEFIQLSQMSNGGCGWMVSLLACHAEDQGSFLPGERKQRHERLN